jgi:2-phospho-L-lactate transferase/gluconeogenesis factor (CofD/UPF0052 family)
MRFIVSLLACISLGGLSTALADPPASPTATAPAATSAPKTSSATATASATAPASTAAASDKSAEADAIVARRMKTAGYHEEMHNGVKQWCREEINTGSRLSSGQKTCATAAQLDAVARETQDQLRQLMGPAPLSTK